MEIEIKQGNKDFFIDEDVVIVIIDVLRAGSTADAIFRQEIKKYIFAKDKHDAFEIKKTQKDVILVGEEKGIKIEGFDIGNSPLEIEKVNLNNKTIVHLTSNGVKALNNNYKSNTYFCGFCNSNALIDYIKLKNYKKIILIATDEISDDDVACADYIKNSLLNTNVAENKIIDRIKNSFAAEKFKSTDDRFSIEDLNYACALYERDYIIKVENDGVNLIATKRK